MFNIFNALVGIGIILGLLLIISVWVLRFLQETDNVYYQFLTKHSLVIAFIFALGATTGSLLYEFVFKLPPCTFCWWQRIFMYPQVIFLGVSIYLKDTKAWLSAILLSIIGSFFSIWHILLQTGIRSGGEACDVAGVSCTSIDVIIFNWITIPIMCLIAFIGILTFMFLYHKKTA